MKWPILNEFDLKKRTILAGYVGSQSHGTYIPKNKDGIDDKDIMGLFVPPIEYYFGLHKKEHHNVWVDEYDLVFYEIRKFISLLLKSNPNVISLLWLPDNMYVKRSLTGNLLIENRSIFSSKKAYKSFVGYAHEQLKKMTHFSFEGYMGEKRKRLVQKFGYDTKNASHLIRLLRMGVEFLSTGEINVLRHDAKELIRIKQGEYSLEKIQDMSSDLFNTAEQALISSNLPNEPNKKEAEKLLIEIVRKNV